MKLITSCSLDLLFQICVEFNDSQLLGRISAERVGGDLGRLDGDVVRIIGHPAERHREVIHTLLSRVGRKRALLGRLLRGHSCGELSGYIRIQDLHSRITLLLLLNCSDVSTVNLLLNLDFCADSTDFLQSRALLIRFPGRRTSSWTCWLYRLHAICSQVLVKILYLHFQRRLSVLRVLPTINIWTLAQADVARVLLLWCIFPCLEWQTSYVVQLWQINNALRNPLHIVGYSFWLVHLCYLSTHFLLVPLQFVFLMLDNDVHVFIYCFEVVHSLGFQLFIDILSDILHVLFNAWVHSFINRFLYLSMEFARNLL